MSLCKYKDIFGSPKQGLHSIRLFDIAVIDLLATILLAHLLHTFTPFNTPILSILLIIFSLFIHKLFCVHTTLTLTLLP